MKSLLLALSLSLVACGAPPDESVDSDQYALSCPNLPGLTCVRMLVSAPAGQTNCGPHPSINGVVWTLYGQITGANDLVVQTWGSPNAILQHALACPLNVPIAANGSFAQDITCTSPLNGQQYRQRWNGTTVAGTYAFANALRVTRTSIGVPGCTNTFNVKFTR